MAGRSFRLRLHSGLRQRGSVFDAVVYGTAEAMPFRLSLAWRLMAGGSPANPHLKGEMWGTRLVNSLYTFMEPFSVGLLITLVSAAILRKKPKVQAGSVAVTA